jgi:hypothetical protein
MIPIPYNGFELHESSGHGKAGKGLKARSSIQVRDYRSTAAGSYLLRKQITFRLDDPNGRNQAIQKAKNFVNDSIKKAEAESQKPAQV